MLSHSVMPYCLRPHGLWTVKLLRPWDFPGKNTEVGCHFLLQGLFPIQGWNLCLLHFRWILCHWATKEAQSPSYSKPISNFTFSNSSFCIMSMYSVLSPLLKIGFNVIFITLDYSPSWRKNRKKESEGDKMSRGQLDLELMIWLFLSLSFFIGKMEPITFFLEFLGQWSGETLFPLSD